jgi:hypothetical protein
MKTKFRLLYFLLFTAAVIFASGCATHSAGQVENPPGFFKGLLHGFIVLFSFIAGLFTDFKIYAFPNTGGWYDFGFLLGVMIFFGGSGARAGK